MGRYARLVAAVLLVAPLHSAWAVGSVHFLIPGGAGGGWDITARATGAALQAAGLLDEATFENRSGAGGGKGVAYMQETAAQNSHVLMVSSTPIVVRTIKPGFQQSWHDLTPIASMIGDYGAIMVRADSPFEHLSDLVRALLLDPRAVKFSGGSNRGDLDHLILAQTFSALKLPPSDARYVPYGAGGQATLALLSGEVDAMSATVGDAIAYSRQGSLRILAVAAEQRLQALPEVPTLTELGYPVVFVNWRGFFGVPGLAADKRADFVGLLDSLRDTKEWQATLSRYGWVEVFHAGTEFERYLERQEVLMRQMLSQLGFVP